MIGKYKTRRQRGFTLLELLIVIGVVGILSSIVIVAVNPAEQFEKARNARRTSDANQLEKAFIQYIIKGNNLPSEVSTGYDGATSICKQTISDSSCINVDSLLTPDYIVAIPQDDEEENPNFSGYVVYQDSEGAPHVNSAYITNWIPGLIGMWRFDEGGGIVAVDSSGNENHGMLSSTGDGELITNGGAETGDTTNFAFDGVTNTDSNTDTYSFYEEGPKSFRSSEFIPIDITKTYNQEGWFKSYGAGGDSRLYFGYVPYDENQVQISHHHVGVITDTEATLIENISSSDTVVKISNCSNWYVLSYGYMAFNIDDSGNYNDLPNRDLSNKGIESVSGDLGGYCEIEFKTTVGKTYPAGTKVRMHKSGGSYMYVAAAGAYIPTVWTSYSSSITGESISGTIYSEGFWRGTRFVKFLFLANYGQDSTFKFRTDDLSIKSVPATYTGPDWASGQIGSALDFDGVDDYV
ncbi:MAG: type II secretion system protein, partial [Candidatus Peribacteraceae bacterium]|nr:type II secretion system protein [Candidatus Peribacteraceae bacterium]